MKTFLFLFCATAFSFAPESLFSQSSVKINTDKTVTIDDVFEMIESQTKCRFLYPQDLFKNAPKVTLKKGIVSLEVLLKKSLYPSYKYTLNENNKNIIITANKEIHQQQKQKKHLIKGVVVDEEGTPILGVTILVQAEDYGVFTDGEGKFSIMATNEDVLKFTSIGYAPKEIKKVGEQTELYVEMEKAVSELDEVQVTAYGKTSKRLSTGNIVTITAKEIKKNPVMNVLQAIKGKVPGVYIEQGSGQAGAAFNIKIRGQNTLTRNAQPLLIIDGVPIPVGSLPENYNGPFGGNNIGGSGLNYVNPNDIETINFLKDAEATSIYGSRGANGVILITMKKGKKGVPKLTVSSRNGVSFRGNAPKLLKTKDYLNYRREAVKNSGDDPSFYNELNGTYDSLRYTDYTKYFFKTPAITSHNSISYSGGSNEVNYIVTGNLNSDQNVQNAKGANVQGGLHFGLNVSNPSNKFTLGLSGTYTTTKNTTIPFNTSSLLAPPNSPSFYNADGSLNWKDFGGTYSNYPNYANVYTATNSNTVNNLISNLNLKFRPIKGLLLTANVGYTQLGSSQLNTKPSTYYPPKSGNTNKSALNQYSKSAITVEPNIAYTKELGDYGTLKLQTGATLQKKFQKRTDLYATNLVSDGNLSNPTLSNKDDLYTKYTSFQNNYIGFFGILNYNYANKYILKASIRKDGSTKFPKGSRFGNFGSVSAGWILSEERWFKKALGFVNYAKIRASYGTSGGDNIEPYKYRSTYQKAFNYGKELGYESEGAVNNTLHWENNQKSEIGVSFEFLNGRIQVSESYYSTISNDQLVDRTASAVTGSPYGTILMNSPATIKNWGHEITLSTKNIVGKKFSWSTSFNVTFSRNKLKAFDAPITELAQINPNYSVGKPVTGLKLYNYKGVNPQTGQYNFWRDLNKNGVVDPKEVGEWTYDLEYSDETAFYNLAPKYYGGITNTFSYKDFSFSFFMNFTKKYVTNFLANQGSGFGGVLNISQDVYNARWQKPGDVTNVPKSSVGYSSYANYISSTGSYQNVLFARLQNANISYNFPSKWLKKINLSSLSIYAQGQNLFVISNYTGGYDPETVGPAVAPLRTIVFGVDFSL